MLTGQPLSVRDAQLVGLSDYPVVQSDWSHADGRLKRELPLATTAVPRGAQKLMNESASQHRTLSSEYPWTFPSDVPGQPAPG